jgi:hypothetical protein
VAAPISCGVHHSMPLVMVAILISSFLAQVENSNAERIYNTTNPTKTVMVANHVSSYGTNSGFIYMAVV